MEQVARLSDSRDRVIRFLRLAALALATLPATAAATGARPNVVVILADDLGWNDVGYHGSEIATPRLDRLAAEGVELDRFYVHPTCSPTRAALMTGRSPLRLGVLRPISKNEATGLPLDNELLPELLREAGYETRMAGKWHLGHALRRFFPHERGFESFYGHVTGGIGYWDHSHGGGHDWQRDGRTFREAGYSTDLIADEAVRRIEARDPTRPLFLYVAFNAPHLPNEAPEASIDRYAAIEDPHRRSHAAMVTELDTAIGRILDALDAAGLGERTIVWFASDNGGLNRHASPPLLVRVCEALASLFGTPLPWAPLEFARTNSLDGGSDNSPLRGGKMTVLEGGVRVPAIVRWPGRFPAHRLDERVTVQDVLPTLLEAVGRGPAAPPLDGASRLDLLAGGAPGPRPDYAISAPGGEAIYRGPWKLILTSSPLPFATAEPELYRIFEDPEETTNLAGEHPEIVDELSDALAALPRGPEIHGPLFDVFLDPDRFGGPEDREPWAEAAR